jgi:hypothetical protein
VKLPAGILLQALIVSSNIAATAQHWEDSCLGALNLSIFGLKLWEVLSNANGLRKFMEQDDAIKHALYNKDVYDPMSISTPCDAVLTVFQVPGLMMVLRPGMLMHNTTAEGAFNMCIAANTASPWSEASLEAAHAMRSWSSCEALGGCADVANTTPHRDMLEAAVDEILNGIF